MDMHLNFNRHNNPLKYPIKYMRTIFKNSTILHHAIVKSQDYTEREYNTLIVRIADFNRMRYSEVRQIFNDNREMFLSKPGKIHFFINLI